MIQRVQSLYLLGVILIGIFGAKYFIQTERLLIEGILCAVSVLLSLITIFCFKKMKFQFVLGRLNILTNLVLLGIFVFYFLNLSGEVTASEKGIERVVPFVNIVLLVLANNAIKKDYKLVKSVDRIR